MIDHAKILGIEQISTLIRFFHREILTRPRFFHDMILPAAWLGTCTAVGISAGEIRRDQTAAGK